jgi:DinB superfamily
VTDRAPLLARYRTGADAVDVVRAVRAASLALLETLGDEEWSRRGTHSEGDAYGVERWLDIYAEHPHEHAAQILAARREPSL